MGLKLRLISLLPLLLLAGSSLAVHDEPTELSPTPLTRDDPGLEMTALPIDDVSESAVDRNQKAVPLNPESAGEGAVHSPIVNQQMIQWGEQLAQVSSDEDKQLLAKLINRDPSILDRNGMFDLLKDWLRERNIVTELPPVLRDVLQIKDPKRRHGWVERLIEIAAARVLGPKGSSTGWKPTLYPAVTCECDNPAGCPSQKTFGVPGHQSVLQPPPCPENIYPPKRRIIEPEQTLSRLHWALLRWFRMNRKPDTEVRPVSAAVANVLLKLNKGNRQWMNLGENDRQDFFEKVATNVVSLAIKSLAEAKRRSLEEVRKVLKESIVDLEMYMLQGEKPGYLVFEKKRQVAKELAKIAREGKVRTLDDAFFVADGLVSSITDELPEGN